MMRKLIGRTAPPLAILALWSLCTAAAPAPPPFFAMDTGTKDAAYQTPESQAAMLAELGYAGIGFTGTEGLPEMLAALDAHGLKLFTVYLTLDIDAAGPNPEIAQAIAALQGRDAILWLTVVSQVFAPSAPEGDAQAVALLQPAADQAAQAGLRIALYPHVDTWLETVGDAVRVAAAAAKDNVGVTFNLYHWLREGNPDALRPAVEQALPKLFAVTINGSNQEGSIETLNQGDFDVLGMLRTLREVGYAGPVGLQGYGIGGEARANLARSMMAWRGLTQLLALDWACLLENGDLSAFREPVGEWTVAGNVFKSPEDEQKLGWEPGLGAVLNGPDGQTAHLVTTMEHGDVEAHIEFLVPKGSNSGVYFQGRYEIQVLDSWGTTDPQYSDCGGIYQRWREEPGLEESQRGYEGRAPRVNAAKAPGEWQSFDVLFRAPRFDASGAKTANAAFLRVLHNGVLVHVNQELSGPTRAAMFNDEQPLGPLMLQGDHGPVAYRNLRVRTVDTRPYPEITGYDYGASRAALLALERDIQSALPDRHAEIEMRLLATFAAPEATFACKQFVCRQLQRTGSDACVLALAPLLTDPRLSHVVRFAFETIPGALVEETMLAALPQTQGDTRIGIINTLGDRRRDQSVEALAALLEDADVNVVCAAAAALGKIATDNAFSALLRATPDGAPEREEALARALLDCATAQLARGDVEKAAGVFEALYAAKQTPALRAAALQGLVTARGAATLPALIEALRGEDGALYAVALQLMRELPAPEVGAALLEALPSFDPERKARVLDVVAARGDSTALPAVLTALQDIDETVRIAALGALRDLGNDTSVAALAQVVATTKGREKAAAEAALARLRGAGVNAALTALLADPSPEVKLACIEALEKRRAAESAQALLEAARDSDARVHAAAVSALGAVAPPEMLAALAAILAQAKEETKRDTEVEAVAAVAARIEDPEARIAALIAALPPEWDAPLAGSVARVLGHLGDSHSLAKLRELLARPEPEVRDAAVRALAGWQHAEALPDLIEIAREGQDDTHRILALRGAIRLVEAPAERIAEDTVNLCATLLELAARPEELKMALGVIGKVSHPGALALAVEKLEDAEVAAEAAQAILQLAEPLAAANGDAVRAALERIIAVLSAHDAAKQAQSFLEQLTQP